MAVLCRLFDLFSHCIVVTSVESRIGEFPFGCWPEATPYGLGARDLLDAELALPPDPDREPPVDNRSCGYGANAGSPVGPLWLL